MLKTDKTTWDLSPMYSSDDDPQMVADRKKVEEANKSFADKWKNRTDYLENPEVLKLALDEYEVLSREYGTDGKEGFYFWLRTTQDENDPVLKAKFAKIIEFGNTLKNQIQFFTLNLAKVPQNIQTVFLESEHLRGYTHYLNRLFAESTYLLSDKEEKILTLKSEPAHAHWVRMTSAFLSKEERQVITEDGKEATKNFTQIVSLMNRKEKTIRDSAAVAFNDVLKKYVEVAEAEINAILTDKSVDDQLRGLPRPDASRHLSDDIETHTVDTMVDAVASRFDLSARFYQLKADMLGVKTLAYHERNVEYGEIDRTYNFAESAALVEQVFEKLDPQFAEIYRRLLANGQVDVYPHKGKHGGAFCAYYSLSLPTYVLLNHTDTLNDVLTIAHEMGHAINDELMREKQNALNFGTPLSTAEVASTFMEDFVLQKLLTEADDELRLALLMTKLNSDISTIFRQIACYRFEQELHATQRKKGYLSSEEIGTIFTKHMKSYMGTAVEQSEGSENWWVYWSHIRSFFYVYSYASGLLISKSLQAGVKANPSFITSVKGFLSSGSSDSPKNIFESLGVNIDDRTFWFTGLSEIEALLNETENVAKKLKKF